MRIVVGDEHNAGYINIVVGDEHNAGYINIVLVVTRLV